MWIIKNHLTWRASIGKLWYIKELIDISGFFDVME